MLTELNMNNHAVLGKRTAFYADFTIAIVFYYCITLRHREQV